jgi:prephenate dehydrogenase
LKRPFFNKIAIVGVGLIGGSLGLAIQKRRLARWVVGVARKDGTLREAVSRRAIHVGTRDLRRALSGAELVILCTPVFTILRQLKNLSPMLGKNTLVMDVGSSKVEITKTAGRCLNRGVFIGCHPMAGSEKCGVEFACPDLFENTAVFLTKPHAKLERFWKSLGAVPKILPAGKHDAWVARASHLPHALAFTLFQDPGKWFPGSIPVNPSLRSLKRLASSRTEIWADIFLSNQTEVLKASKEFLKNLGRFQKALETKNRSALVRFIDYANQRSS